MTNEELQLLTEKISIELFGRPFLHKAIFNSRLRTTGGRYMLRSHNIEVNKKYLEAYGQEELEGIIKHELCHYHLHLEGKGYKHGDQDFKQLLREVNGPRHCTPLEKIQPKKRTRVLVYECSSCHLVYKRKRKINTGRYVCGKCRGVIVCREEIESNGE
ncbi:SprT family protein [Pseudobacillus wudalianchiensis]|uniref:Protein SprT-like n=1 Tax=Pseudobacillus wudalianchiensis TaxID=1743143 RepID=A0A1B9AAT6_9BACI|nr:SprT family protein [Bacillus wudalianchiensis]OCA80963.1 SprT family protein [Bacillus wudalianchiensis]